MYNFFLKALLIVSVIFLWNSCDNEIDFEINDTLLTFSKDTVYLDTVFTNIGSSTYNLKVYNNSSKNILIPEIKLSNGENSFFRLNVDGIYNQDNDHGKSFENIELLANDSLYIFIETTIDINDIDTDQTSFLYDDKIEFLNSINPLSNNIFLFFIDELFEAISLEKDFVSIS